MSNRKLLSLILNLTTVVITTVGLFITGVNIDHFYYFVKFFTLVTNCSIVIASLISLGFIFDFFTKKEKYKPFGNFVYIFKLCTAVNALITFLTVVLFLQYQPYMIHGWSNFILHYFSPLMYIFIFLVCDNEKKFPIYLFPTGLTVLTIYTLYAVPLANIPGVWDGSPYVFIDLKVVKFFALLLIPLFFGLATVFSFLLWLFNRISYLIFTGEELKSQDKLTKEEKRIASKVEVTPEDERAVALALREGFKAPRVYHISRRQDRKWQVKFAKGKRAIKLFNTQAEAIVFAKKLAKTQEGSIRIHSIGGRIRKGH